MRANVSHYHIKSPTDLTHALELLSETPRTWQLIAGGTDLMVLLEAGHLKGNHFLNLWDLSELKGIHSDDDYLSIGALTTYTQIRQNPEIQKKFPNLCEGARETGAISIQNRGTLGGNIANASPAADSPPALLCYDAELELLSLKGSRWISYSDFHLSYKKTALRADELISRIRLPLKHSYQRHYYRKVGTRKAQAISKVCVSAVFQIHQGIIKDLRIAMGSVAPIPFRCKNTESVLRIQKISPTLIQAAQAELAHEIKPISDIRSTDHYRLKVAQNLLEESIQKAAMDVELAQQS